MQSANPHSEQSNGCIPIPQTARSPGAATLGYCVVCSMLLESKRDEKPNSARMGGMRGSMALFVRETARNKKYFGIFTVNRAHILKHLNKEYATKIRAAFNLIGTRLH